MGLIFAGLFFLAEPEGSRVHLFRQTGHGVVIATDSRTTRITGNHGITSIATMSIAQATITTFQRAKQSVEKFGNIGLGFLSGTQERTIIAKWFETGITTRIAPHGLET